ncbi:DUF3577 domain-containing protein [Comamonas terrigena]|uniref:DUF3577 domain-containing protein n=1 Tax=Comamonas terrigena TaxID=32013 RepID=UPI0024490EEA|nr:DUF3577 domain-containing protein [Comamonas terrigena]MDH1503205.1 DUF3577 domain-containing protein [Comamonas terrigena]
MQAQAAQREYFNLHTTGIGYLNRIRWVDVKGRGRRSEPFLACAINALRGSSDSAEYTYFDLRVSGEDAIGLIENMQETVNRGAKVVVSFRVGDTYPHLYDREVKVDGRPTGKTEPAVLLKGRLLVINSISVDGQKVYERPAGQEDASASLPGTDPEQYPQGEAQDEIHHQDHHAQAPDRGNGQWQGRAPAHPRRNAQQQGASHGQRQAPQQPRYGTHREHSFAE